jgi:hypothetical protein
MRTCLPFFYLICARAGHQKQPVGETGKGVHDLQAELTEV